LACRRGLQEAGRTVQPHPAHPHVTALSWHAGEDNKNFKLTDLDSTFASFAGADYNLQVGMVAGAVVVS
jgi:hypothetical protein